MVVPGYNLPDNIFNKGRPFYLEKDPVTGMVDFNSKTPSHFEDDYEYVYDEQEPVAYDKSNIDRKDGSIYSHKKSDINQLTPNFHDFLNLPVKYNPEKYVVPLISSSYANTKIQGNVNKIHNHKDVTTYKPTVSPMYYTTKPSYYNQFKKTAKPTNKPVTTTTTEATTQKQSSTKIMNLMQSPMNHPSFNYEREATKKVNDVYITTESNLFDTTKSFSTTKKTMSLFEQLFGGYEEEEVETTPHSIKQPTLFNNLPPNKNKAQSEETNMQLSTTIKPVTEHQNVLMGNQMHHESAYEYEDEYNNEYNIPDNIATENKQYENVINYEVKKPFIEDEYNVTVATTTTTIKPTISTTFSTTKKINLPETTSSRNEVVTTKKTIVFPQKEENFYTTPSTPPKVTSLPLGENHVTYNNQQSIIVATQNLKQQLNFEKVSKPTAYNKTVFQHAPSTSNIHIAHDQDTVSFVVGNQQNVAGHHQNVESGHYIGSDLKVSPYDHNPFRPLYSQEPIQNHVRYGAAPISNIFNVPINENNDINTHKNNDVQSNKEQAGNSVSLVNVGNSINVKPSLNSISFLQLGTSSMNNQPLKNTDASLVMSSSSTNIQPLKNSEASLSIGVPVNNVKIVPGQVVDEKLEINKERVEFPQGSGSKIVFPDEKEITTIIPDLVPPPQKLPMPNRDVLKLNSKPMFHQLPSELLTPPSEKEVATSYAARPRPPWDPRPGHFYSGRPEYARPPRPPLGPQNSDIYKRIDNLPNILPQFRPNIKTNQHMHFGNMNKGYMRQPLLERPSNRPIGFFEKLQPPPPPKHFHNLRKGPMPPLEIRQNLPPFDYEVKLRQNVQKLEAPVQLNNTRDVNSNESKLKVQNDQFAFYQTPPNIVIANRRNGEDDPEVETLQMIQAKQAEKPEKETLISFNANLNAKDENEKPLYVVYPVNSAPLKLDVLNSKKESVVVGTRAELPLPPSKINKHEQDPLLNLKDRHDSPILKPHSRPSNYPIKSDFPYAIERPDPSVLTMDTTNNENKLDTNVDKFLKNQDFPIGNQWNSLGDNEPKIINSGKIESVFSNQISATLKTYTEKPIAVAYTPTEPHYKEYTDKYSMPNYGSAVIPEIRPGTVHNANVQSSQDEFTVSAIMHTHPQLEAMNKLDTLNRNKITNHENQRKDTDIYTTHVPQISQLDFQAPFQASVNLDSVSHGWSVVRDKSKTTKEVELEVTTMPIASTSEFDIENFKPQLIGGFKPIYNYPDDEEKEKVINDRKE